MISVPSADPVGALVPHTLREPLPGAASGPLAGLTFMVKDLFAIAGRKVSNGNPDFYEHATPAHETAPVITRLLEAGASCTGITICDEFFYSVLGSNAHYGQPINSRAPKHVTGGSSCGSAAAVAASCATSRSAATPAARSACRRRSRGCTVFARASAASILQGATAMAPSYDTIGFLAREAQLFRKIGHVLLAGDSVEAKIDRLILAEDFFGHAEASADQALWRVLASIGPALPAPEHRTVAGEEIDEWRDAFRLIQGFELQSTLLPFIESHNVDLGPGIKERFEAAAQISFAEADAARNKRKEIAQRLGALLPPGTVLVLPTTPTLPPEREIPDGASFAEFRTQTLGYTCLAGHAGLPQISIPATEAAGCPIGLSFIGWRGGDEALLDLAVTLAHMPNASSEGEASP